MHAKIHIINNTEGPICVIFIEAKNLHDVRRKGQVSTRQM